MAFGAARPALTAVATLATVAVPTVTTRTAMLATVATVTVGTGTTGRFDVAFRFGLKGPHGQPHLAGLLVNLKELDIDFLSNREDILYVLSLVPGNF